MTAILLQPLPIYSDTGGKTGSAASSSTQSGVLEIAELFSDHMVMQRGMPVPVWGWSKPGDEVSVSIDQQTKTATADAAGRWMVKLDAMETGAPRKMKVEGKSEALEIKDILLGEVWICAGQSNMMWPLVATIDGKKEAAAADFPQIRLFEAGNGISPTERRERMDPKSSPDGGATLKCVWSPCSPESVKGFSAAGYYFGRALHQDLKVPIGLVLNAVGATPVESWMSRECLSSDPELKHALDYWDKMDAFAETPEGKAQLKIIYDTYDALQSEARKAGKHIWRKGGYSHPLKRLERACGLFNGRVNPLVPFAMRGVIWYQGEGNTSNAYEYRKYFPALIQDWRNQWGQGDFPFLFVQLASWGGPPPVKPMNSEWAELRESQTLALKMKNTAMAVTVDIGDPANIHPGNKKDVGARLALAARAAVYGEKIVASGPLYRSFEIEGNEIRLSFDSIGGGLVAKDGPLKSFAIAGDDKNFVWAKAEIQGETIVVSADQVRQPVAVRYGWFHNSHGNLYNAESLPASPFRTDSWPGVTDNKGFKSRAGQAIAFKVPKSP